MVFEGKPDSPPRPPQWERMTGWALLLRYSPKGYDFTGIPSSKDSDGKTLNPKEAVDPEKIYSVLGGNREAIVRLVHDPDFWEKMDGTTNQNAVAHLEALFPKWHDPDAEPPSFFTIKEKPW